MHILYFLFDIFLFFFVFSVKMMKVLVLVSRLWPQSKNIIFFIYELFCVIFCLIICFVLDKNTSNMQLTGQCILILRLYVYYTIHYHNLPTILTHSTVYTWSRLSVAGWKRFVYWLLQSNTNKMWY